MEVCCPDHWYGPDITTSVLPSPLTSATSTEQPQLANRMLVFTYAEPVFSITDWPDTSAINISRSSSLSRSNHLNPIGVKEPIKGPSEKLNAPLFIKILTVVPVYPTRSVSPSLS